MIFYIIWCFPPSSGFKPGKQSSIGLLPDTQNCGCACARNAGNVFPVTAGERSWHASRHVRHARAVMHAGIANYRFPLKSPAGENVTGIPGACATCNFTYLVRGPCPDAFWHPLYFWYQISGFLTCQMRLNKDPLNQMFHEAILVSHIFVYRENNLLIAGSHRICKYHILSCSFFFWVLA